MAGHQSHEYSVTARIWHFESKLRAGELLTVGPREASKPNKNRFCGSYTLSSRLKAACERIVELWNHVKRLKCVLLFSARTVEAKVFTRHVMHVYVLALSA